MKKIYSNFVFTFALSIFYTVSLAQNAIITTVAGNGSYSSMTGGDGGAATAASILCPRGLVISSSGELYIQESCSFGSQALRKITTSGIISSIVTGSGTTLPPLPPAAIPAAGALLEDPCNGIAIDSAGEIFIPVGLENAIFKVNAHDSISYFAFAATSTPMWNISNIGSDTHGNIYLTNTTGSIIKISPDGSTAVVAGGGYSAYTDSVPATSIYLTNLRSIKCDDVGNLYISQYSQISKVNTLGIITTIAGTGTAGFSGDGGSAKLAQIRACDLNIDYAGNVYFSDSTSRIRKISTSGIITTIAGNGISGFSGDGGSAKTAELNLPMGIAFDGANNIYFSDCANYRVRKLAFIPNASSDSFSVYTNEFCSGADFTIATNHFTAGMSVKTWYGDGQKDSSLVFACPSGGYASFSHLYASSGAYTLKHVLYVGTSPVDSVTFSFDYTFCRTIPVKFYYDSLMACTFDSSSPNICTPLTVEIDSNAIPIDTISATSGIYYDAKGGLGDIYTCKVISDPLGFYSVCPASGIINDTLSNTTPITKYIGFNCSTTPGFDIGENAYFLAGRHEALALVLIYNNKCEPEDGNLTINFSPKYIFSSASPTPSAMTTHSLSWYVSDISSSAGAPHAVSVTFKIPTSTWLTPGDTIHSFYNLVPSHPGDINMSNNTDSLVDTVTGSFDPNEMDVIPSGYILAGTQLQYTIKFENTGNDTAHNIYVMDTLSDNVDPMSLKIIGASAAMNTSKATWPNIQYLNLIFRE